MAAREGLMIAAAATTPRSRFVPGRPRAPARSNLVRAESVAFLGLEEAYRQLAETPTDHPATSWRRRKVADWRRQWQRALADLDQARGGR